MSFKVLVTVPWFKSRPALQRHHLRQAGCEVIINQKGGAYDEADLLDILPGVDATIAGSEPYNEKTLAVADAPKMINAERLSGEHGARWAGRPASTDRCSERAENCRRRARCRCGRTVANGLAALLAG